MNAETKYAELDSAILEYISLHYGKCPANSMMLESIARKANPFSYCPWRIVDRRTQYLRRAGKIKLDSKRKWVINKNPLESDETSG